MALSTIPLFTMYINPLSGLSCALFTMNASFTLSSFLNLVSTKAPPLERIDADVAVILMTETLVSLCPDLIYDLKLNRKKPLIVEIPDRHGNGRTKDSITKYVQDAIGVKL